jgi:hypothetical protein
MGAKSSKAAVVVNPSRTFGYDMFGNYEDTDTVIYDTSNNIYSIIMAIVLGYSIVFYSFVYFRRRYSRYK